MEMALVLLWTLPGISGRAAEIILAEIGLQMSRFSSRQPSGPPSQACILAITTAWANGSGAAAAKAIPGCARFLHGTACFLMAYVLYLAA